MASFLYTVHFRALSHSILSSFNLRETPPTSSSRFYLQFSRMPSTPFPSRLHRDTILGSIHTIQIEILFSRVLCPTQVRWTGGKDRQTSGSSVRRRFWRAGGRGVKLLTWLQTGLYLSPSLFTIYSSCLWLKLDTPMDLVSLVSLHFSRAWEGGVVSSHLEWARTRINVEKINKHGHHQELALSIKRKKGRKSSHQLKNYYFCLKKTNKQTKKTYHVEGKKCLVFAVQNSPFHSSMWTFQQWFPPLNPSIPALRFMNCWVWWFTAHSHRWKK